MSSTLATRIDWYCTDEIAGIVLALAGLIMAKFLILFHDLKNVTYKIYYHNFQIFALCFTLTVVNSASR